MMTSVKIWNLSPQRKSVFNENGTPKITEFTITTEAQNEINKFDDVMEKDMDEYPNSVQEIAKTHSIEFTTKIQRLGAVHCFLRGDISGRINGDDIKEALPYIKERWSQLLDNLARATESQRVQDIRIEIRAYKILHVMHTKTNPISLKDLKEHLEDWKEKAPPDFENSINFEKPIKGGWASTVIEQVKCAGYIQFEGEKYTGRNPLQLYKTTEKGDKFYLDFRKQYKLDEIKQKKKRKV